MRLYALNKRQVVVVFLLFFICLFINILIGIVGPSVIQSIDYKSENPATQLVNIIFLIFKYLIKSFYFY